jgi:hypothetical protein
MLKRIITILFILLASFLSIAQTHQKQYEVEENVNADINYINWQLSDNGCYGCASFYWSVTMFPEPDDYGYYYFFTWFYSNSFHENGEWSSTYVWGVTLLVDGYKINNEPAWLTFKEEFCPQLFWFKSKNRRPDIRLVWGGKKIL